MSIPDRDLGEDLLEAVRAARRDGVRIAISGSGSKRNLVAAGEDAGSGSTDARLLSTVEHRGIIDYRPEELVVTARSGTPMKEVERALGREKQMLPFEAPQPRGLGTLGGVVAAGLSGPAAPWRGGVRDALLGVTLLNGLGQRLRFGGQVMKNVAGYDVSRLQAGAFGTLGLLLEISLRVAPAPIFETTVCFPLDAAAALEKMRQLARQPLPLSGCVFHDDQLYVRLSGAPSAVQEAQSVLGGRVLSEDGFWQAVRDFDLPCFRVPGLAVSQGAPARDLGGNELLLDWAGGRRWHDGETAALGNPIRFGAGYARYLLNDGGGCSRRAAVQRRLKAAFDPDGIFNEALCDADPAA